MVGQTALNRPIGVRIPAGQLKRVPLVTELPESTLLIPGKLHFKIKGFELFFTLKEVLLKSDFYR